MAVEIVATLTPVMILAIGQIATITNNTAAPLLLKRASSAPASITKPDNIIPAFTTETVSAGDKPFYGVWQAALTPSGEAIVNEVKGFSFVNPNIRFSAFRKSNLSQGETALGVLIDASEEVPAGKSIYIHAIEARVEKGNRLDTDGSVSAIFVKTINASSANVLFFGGDFWDDGKQQSVNTFSDGKYNLTIDENGDFTNGQSTGISDTSSINTGVPLARADGAQVIPDVGDLLFRMENKRAGGDTASITVFWEPI